MHAEACQTVRQRAAGYRHRLLLITRVVQGQLRKGRVPADGAEVVQEMRVARSLQRQAAQRSQPARRGATSGLEYNIPVSAVLR
jgi:hypothetical protein